MKRNVATEVGTMAADLLDSGLEVNADIAAEEPECPQGVDADVLKLVRKHGVKGVLGAIHAAAWGAADVHEDMDSPEDVTVLRLRIFGKRLGDAIEALK